MARSKATPTRRPRTTTLVGCAAHALSASSGSPQDDDDGDDALSRAPSAASSRRPTTTATTTTIASGGAVVRAPRKARAAPKVVTPNAKEPSGEGGGGGGGRRRRRRVRFAADADDDDDSTCATEGGSRRRAVATKRRRRLSPPRDRADDEDDDDDNDGVCAFDEPPPAAGEPGAASTPAKRRRIIVDDDDDDDDGRPDGVDARALAYADAILASTPDLNAAIELVVATVHAKVKARERSAAAAAIDATVDDGPTTPSSRPPPPPSPPLPPPLPPPPRRCGVRAGISSAQAGRDVSSRSAGGGATVKGRTLTIDDCDGDADGGKTTCGDIEIEDRSPAIDDDGVAGGIASIAVLPSSSSSARGDENLHEEDASDCYELVRLRLRNARIDLPSGLWRFARRLALTTKESAATILGRCNEEVSNSEESNRRVDVDPILSAFDEGMLRIDISAGDGDRTDVSISLLYDRCVEKLRTAQRSKRMTPPIPVPRRSCDGPHPSYALIRALGGIFAGSVFADVSDSLRARRGSPRGGDVVTAKMVYGVVDNAHASEFEGATTGDATPSLDIPDLVSALRPYQEAAVRWMLRREGKIDVGAEGDEECDNEWELCWHVIVESPDVNDGSIVTRSNVLPLPEWRARKSCPEERRIFCNPFAGWLASSYEEARRMMLGEQDGDAGVKGGILADSMGLGKTVEVLACVLANKHPMCDEVADQSVQHRDSADVQPNTLRSVAKPLDLKDSACICGRSKSYNNCLSWVVCKGCNEAMHGRCAGFDSEEHLVSETSESPHSGARVCSHCPSCVAFEAAQNQSMIESRATLIVTPPAILTQWQREISRHTKDVATGKPLKVIVYPGVKEIGGARSPSPHKDFHLVQPHILADADVVLVTFQALMGDLGHTDDNPYAGFQRKSSCLRSKKRYKVLPSPLSSIKWWRVCLDEAQRVDAPTAASARMARKLITDKRWCVSGTPISRGRLDDLYGLLLFLSMKPFDEKTWFSSSFVLSQGDALKRIAYLLRNIMWRSTKENAAVRRQMHIPEQEERKVSLRFSSVERYFYDQLHEDVSKTAGRIASTYGSHPSFDYIISKLDHSLQKLRAACCHPQVGAGRIGGRVRTQQGLSVAQRVLTMEQILEKLIEEAKGKCEEAQRIATLHTVGVASLLRLKAETHGSDLKLLEKSYAHYQEALNLAEVNASPTEVIAPATLHGSNGFRSDKKSIYGSCIIDWQLRRENISQDIWSSISFAGSRTINRVRVQPCHSLPSEIEQSHLGSWNILMPNVAILQASSNALGGAFVDVCSFTISEDKSEWSEVSSFHAKKSKVWRIVIKSFHNYSGGKSVLETLEDSTRYYIGLNLQLFEPEIAEDSLQQLHILHNAGQVLSTLTQSTNGEANNERRSKMSEMERMGKAIYDNYMAAAHNVHRQSKYHLSAKVKACQRCDEELKDVSESPDGAWFEDGLSWLAMNSTEQVGADFCRSIRNALFTYYESNNAKSGLAALSRNVTSLVGAQEKKVGILIRNGEFPQFSSVSGLLMALKMRIKQGQDEAGLTKGMSVSNCINRVENLSHMPSEGEVHKNSHCRRCREDWQQMGPVCSHCHLEDEITVFEQLSNDPELACVLKAIAKFINDLSIKLGSDGGYLKFINQRALAYFKSQEALKEEIKAAKTVWKAHFDLLSDVDELNQCRQTMRLQQEDDDVSLMTKHESAFIIHPDNIAVESMQHEMSQASALAALRRDKEKMTYLKTKRLEQRAVGGNETCSVCLSGFDEGTDRSVLPCGHVFHPTCVEQLFKKGVGIIRCPMRCPVAIKEQDILIASAKSKFDGSNIHRQIIGDWGTKVNRLVGDVMDMLQMGDRGVIFSQWEEMLDIIAIALEANSVDFIRPKSGSGKRKFGDGIQQFRSSGCPLLLMNVKNGAEGLTLTEANHVFMVEPILNCGLDLQAINRIHRIGQLSKTFVHRYIIADTIEEKIDAIRLQRQENHFEDDIEEQKKHSIKAGGIDGGFDMSELRQLFQ